MKQIMIVVARRSFLWEKDIVLPFEHFKLEQDNEIRLTF